MNTYTNTALNILQELNYDLNILNRFANLKHINYDDTTGERTIVFKDNSYITIRNNNSIINGTNHNSISLNETIICDYMY